MAALLRAPPRLLLPRSSTAAAAAGILFNSSFSAAAAARYDDYEYDEYDGDLDTQGSKPVRGVHWIVLGAKRHVYARRLSELLHVPHISMPELLLHHLRPHSYVYNQIENAVSQGKLVPEDVILGLLSNRLDEGRLRGESGFILDGIPRTMTQAKILDQIVDIDLVLNFKCDELERKPVNGLNIHLQGSHMKSLSEAAQREKLRTYAEQSKLLENYYRRQNKLLDFKVDDKLGKTWQDLLSVLQLQHMSSSFQKLTA